MSLVGLLFILGPFQDRILLAGPGVDASPQD